ncbi:SDR family NAD(P)-dependent oxidoreductase [Desulfovibrio sp. OH1186_COT-070]|nr:SDR family NAD(P)-dependent oxidoreductase [Desulfovibrio sp. OH1209_COT-279]RRD85459.1 SDR family NAD(P)-dependent oxidoreductase [Desulfovibrio sp. OH1186_COT-070]
MDIQEKVALVAGATSGIGEAAAIMFARRGASVMLSGRRENLLHAIVNCSSVVSPVMLPSTPFSACHTLSDTPGRIFYIKEFLYETDNITRQPSFQTKFFEICRYGDCRHQCCDAFQFFFIVGRWIQGEQYADSLFFTLRKYSQDSGTDS